MLFKAVSDTALLGMIHVELNHFCHDAAPFQPKWTKCKRDVHRYMLSTRNETPAKWDQRAEKVHPIENLKEPICRNEHCHEKVEKWKQEVFRQMWEASEKEASLTIWTEFVY